MEIGKATVKDLPMLRKMEAAMESGVEKLITFEFSHFMSPNSINPEARNLHDRYCEWLKRGKGK